MKKSLLNSIILSAAALGLGMQVNHTVTVQADEVDSSEQDTTDLENQNEIFTELEGQTSDPETEEPDETVGEVSNPQTSSEESNGEATTEESKSDNESVIDKIDDKEVVTKTIEVSKTHNRTNVSDGKTPFLTVKPLKEVEHTDDPANYGDLLVPYVYHGNAAVFKLDENNQPILDATSSTGYAMKKFEDIYDPKEDLGTISGNYTGDIYSVTNDINRENPNKKEQMLLALENEGAFFMKFENHGYSNLADLETYMKNYKLEYANIINNYNDDGTIKTPVIENQPVTVPTKTTHIHSSTTTKATTTVSEDILNMTVTTIRQANLYTKDGKTVGNRGLVNNSTWRVKEIATINGQKMYRVSDNEWVADNDVK